MASWVFSSLVLTVSQRSSTWAQPPRWYALESMQHRPELVLALENMWEKSGLKTTSKEKTLKCCDRSIINSSQYVLTSRKKYVSSWTLFPAMFQKTRACLKSKIACYGTDAVWLALSLRFGLERGLSQFLWGSRTTKKGKVVRTKKRNNSEEGGNKPCISSGFSRFEAKRYISTSSCLHHTGINNVKSGQECRFPLKWFILNCFSVSLLLRIVHIRKTINSSMNIWRTMKIK